MDERTDVLVGLGAATAANCVPCFEHYFKKTDAVGLTPEDIQEAVDLATKVKNGAHLVIRNSIKNLMGQEGRQCQPGIGKSGSSCCR